MIIKYLIFLFVIPFLGTLKQVQAANDLWCVNGETLNTAIGCINPDITRSGGLITQVINIGIGIGGAAALLLMLYGTFLITTSAGIPDKIKAGQETITAAITGLLFIIFSVVILNIIGVQLLVLPGF